MRSGNWLDVRASAGTAQDKACVEGESLEGGQRALDILGEVTEGCPEKAVLWTVGVWTKLRAYGI